MQEGKIPHLGGVVKVDQDADALTRFGVEDSLEESLEVEWWEIQCSTCAFSSRGPDGEIVVSVLAIE
jgi:hypothetical protein